MTTANRAVHARSPRGSLVLGLLAIGGGVLGWSSATVDPRMFAYVYALVAPTCTGLLCVSSLSREANHSRWLVPLLLVGVMVNITLHPHDTAFSAVGVAAGGVAIVACIRRDKRIAAAASVFCCCAISVTLLVS